MANRAMHVCDVCDEGIRPKSLHALKCVFGHFKTAPPTSTIGGKNTADVWTQAAWHERLFRLTHSTSKALTFCAKKLKQALHENMTALNQNKEWKTLTLLDSSKHDPSESDEERATHCTKY